MNKHLCNYVVLISYILSTTFHIKTADNASLAIVPSEIMLQIFDQIGRVYKFPWQALTGLLKIKTVCVNWNRLLSEKPAIELLHIPPLHYAAARGDIREILRLKLKEKECITMPDSRGLLASHYACGMKHLDTIKLLDAAYATVEVQQLPLAEQEYITLEEVVPILVTEKIEKFGDIFFQKHAKKMILIDGLIGYMKNEKSKLSQVGRDYVLFIAQGKAERFARDAIDKNNSHGLDLFLDNMNDLGSHVNACCDIEGYALLHRACMQPQSSEIVQRLLQEPGIDINRKAWDRNQTPLHIAAYCDNLKAVQLLLGSKNCDLTACDNDGKGPLHFAGKSKNIEIMDLLLAHHSHPHESINQKTQNGQAPLSFAVQYDNAAIMLYLVEKYADIKTTDIYNNTLWHWAALHNSMSCIPILTERYKDGINSKDDKGFTPLMCAISKKQPHTLIQLLITAGAHTNQQDHGGNVALSYVSDADTVYYLCNQGADPNIPSASYVTRKNRAYTPLHYAAGDNNFAVVKALVACGANKSLCTADNKTAAQLADENGYSDIVTYLRE